ncbi:amidohydrolase family protein [Streptomyces sp. NPDC051742]|uniref:amidohydrolase family protein n=1 Tax=unclassified Streptomyces TaxID=2593676 RepID=UPI0034143ACB
MLSQTAGHADFRLPSGIDAGAVATRVREPFAAAADCVKLAASGGVTSPHDQPEWLGLRAEMVARGQFLVPTLLETMADPDPSAVPAAVHAKAVHWHRVAQESVARSVTAGIRVGMGTDAGLIAPHGQNLKELGLLVRIGGMTPLQAIRAATSEAADLCGVGDTTGRRRR